MNKNTQRYFTNDVLNTVLEGSSLVILDMNGLIVDDEEIQFQSVNRALKPLKIRISEDYWIEACVGKRAHEFFRTILSLHEIDASAPISELVDKKNNEYRRLIQSCVKNVTRPGAVEFIEYVAEHPGLKLALSTAALPEEVEAILGSGGMGLLDRFDSIATGRDVTKGKPDPEIYSFLSRKTGIPSYQCLAFEDSATGVSAASNAGMNCIAIPNRYTAGQDFNKALFIIDSLTRNAVILKKFSRKRSV